MLLLAVTVVEGKAMQVCVCVCAPEEEDGKRNALLMTHFANQKDLSTSTHTHTHTLQKHTFFINACHVNSKLNQV